MAKKRFYANEEYAGRDSRRAMEARDFNMISEDRSAVANLPQQVVMKDWPKARHYSDYGLNDTIGGINKQMDEDHDKMERHLQPGKY